MEPALNILISVFSDPFWTFPDAEVQRLRTAFPQHVFHHATNEAELMGALRVADVAFLSMLDAPLLARAARLRWVHSPAAGVGRLLSPEMRASGIVLTNSRGIHAQSMAEHVIGVSVALSRRLHEAVRWQQAHTWQKVEIASMRLLHGRHMAVIGLGAIGSTVARMAAAMGMRVSGVRRRAGLPVPEGVESVHAPQDLAAVLQSADIAVLAAPLTEETRGMIGGEQLRQMKRSAFLVNIARGKLVDERALADALANGTIAGAALDVFEHEPLDAASPLWDLPNVILTAHTSGYFAEYWAVAADLFAANLRRFECGGPLMNVVDKQAGY